MCTVCSKGWTRKTRAKLCCPSPKTNHRLSARNHKQTIMFGGDLDDLYNMEVRSRTGKKVEHVRRTAEEERLLARDIREQEFVEGDAVFVKSNAVNSAGDYIWYRADVKNIEGRQYTIKYTNFKNASVEKVSRTLLMSQQHYNTKHYRGTAPTPTGKNTQKPMAMQFDLKLNFLDKEFHVRNLSLCCLISLLLLNDL